MDSTAECMIEAATQEIDDCVHAGETTDPIKRIATAVLLASLRALAKAGPSDGMTYASYKYECETFGPLARGLKHSVIFEKQIAQLIAELEREPK